MLIGVGAGCAFKPSLPQSGIDTFVLERDFGGRTVGQGYVSAINGAYRAFTAYLNGTWDGTTLTLVEDFVYDDCTKERKTWRFTKLKEGEWSGTREDVVGLARGYQDKKGFRIEYKMQITDDEGNPGKTLSFKDILFKRPDGVVVNNAVMGWFGFKVGKVRLVVERRDAIAAQGKIKDLGPIASGEVINCSPEPPIKAAD